MSPDLPLRNLDNLVSDLFTPTRASRSSSSLGWALALSLHAAGFGLALSHRSERLALERPPIEVELPRAIEPPPPPPPEPPAAKAAEPQEPARAAAAHVAAPPPPSLARAGALHTAKDDPSVQPQPSEPLDFTHDPSVVGFGAGVVAVGGTARLGTKGAVPTPERAAPSVAAAPAPHSTGESLTAAADLGRKPVLGVSDPCHGYFPSGASDDVASASVMVVVSKTGSVSSASVISENPKGEGFGAAARACMQNQHFTPALDREGRPTATAIRVNVRFAR